MKRRIITGVAVVGWFLLMAPSALAQRGNDPLARAPTLKKILERDGFIVTEGKHFVAFKPVENVCGLVRNQTMLPSTFYNNLGAPYVALALNPAPEDAHPDIPPFYPVREDEAVVVVGRTPPPVAYFSWQTFVFGRYNQNSTSFLGHYDILWSYVDDPINSLNIQTIGPDPYDRPMAIISTGHRKTLERVRAALLAAGYSASTINTETLSPSLVRLGYGDEGDHLLSLVRVAIPRPGHEQAVQDYIDNPPLAAFRVRPRDAFAPDPLPVPVLRTRGTGHTEMGLYATLQKLRHAVLDQPGAGYQATELDTDVTWTDNWLAKQRNLVWIADGVHEGSEACCRDTIYHSTPWFDLPADGFAMVYGVNHAATGKATYSAATVYLDPILTIGVSSIQSPVMAGTANPYLPGDPAADQFYVWKVKRDCLGEANCMDARLLLDPGQECKPLPPDPKVRIMFRCYAEPATTVAPIDAELLFDRVIVFRPQ